MLKRADFFIVTADDYAGVQQYWNGSGQFSKTAKAARQYESYEVALSSAAHAIQCARAVQMGGTINIRHLQVTESGSLYGVNIITGNVEKQEAIAV